VSQRRRSECVSRLGGVGEIDRSTQHLQATRLHASRCFALVQQQQPPVTMTRMCLPGSSLTSPREAQAQGKGGDNAQLAAGYATLPSPVHPLWEEPSVAEPLPRRPRTAQPADSAPAPGPSCELGPGGDKVDAGVREFQTAMHQSAEVAVSLQSTRGSEPGSPPERMPAEGARAGAGQRLEPVMRPGPQGRCGASAALAELEALCSMLADLERRLASQDLGFEDARVCAALALVWRGLAVAERCWTCYHDAEHRSQPFYGSCVTGQTS